MLIWITQFADYKTMPKLMHFPTESINYVPQAITTSATAIFSIRDELIKKELEMKLQEMAAERQLSQQEIAE